MELKQVAAMLKHVREQKRISKKAVSRSLGYKHVGSVTSIEEGDNPTLGSLQRYADALGITLKIEVQSMKVISFFNHAGGIGKTSAVRDIGHSLSERGFRVLVIDCDPQANLTQWLGLDDHAIRREETIVPGACLLGRAPEEVALPEPRHVFGLDLIPASEDVEDVEEPEPGDVNGYVRLRRSVQKLEGYDFVLLDCPPRIGKITMKALIASDYVVVPLPTNDKGLRSLKRVMAKVDQARELSPNLAIAAFLLTQFDARTSIDKEALEKFQKLSAYAPVLGPLHNRPGPYKGASKAAMPLSLYDPRSEAVSELEKVTDDLLERLHVQIVAEELMAN